jgi:hypothetical protein
MKYGSARKCRRKFRRKFPGITVPNTTGIHELINKIWFTGSLLDNKPAKNTRCPYRRNLEHTSQKSLRRLAQETSISKSSAAEATKLLKLRQYKATVVHVLQPCVPASRINFYNWFLQSVHDGEVGPHLTFFLMRCFICIVVFPPKIICTGVLLIHI